MARVVSTESLGRAHGAPQPCHHHPDLQSGSCIRRSGHPKNTPATQLRCLSRSGIILLPDLAPSARRVRRSYPSGHKSGKSLTRLRNRFEKASQTPQKRLSLDPRRPAESGSAITRPGCWLTTSSGIEQIVLVLSRAATVLGNRNRNEPGLLGWTIVTEVRCRIRFPSRRLRVHSITSTVSLSTSTVSTRPALSTMMRSRRVTRSVTRWYAGACCERLGLAISVPAAESQNQAFLKEFRDS